MSTFLKHFMDVAQQGWGWTAPASRGEIVGWIVGAWGILGALGALCTGAIVEYSDWYTSRPTSVLSEEALTVVFLLAWLLAPLNVLVLLCAGLYWLWRAIIPAGEHLGTGFAQLYHALRPHKIPVATVVQRETNK